MVVLILHSKRFGSREILYDDIDRHLIEGRKWSLSGYANGKNCYPRTYSSTKGGKKLIFTPMHRLILGLTDPKIYVDHKNGNGCDNRRSNIRIATYSQNNYNASVSKRSKTGLKGVTIRYNKYVARIQVNKKLIGLGTFTDINQANKAYNDAAKHYFGEFARLNNCVQCNHNTNIHFRVINSLDAVDSGTYGYCKGCQSTIYSNL